MADDCMQKRPQIHSLSRPTAILIVNQAVSPGFAFAFIAAISLDFFQHSIGEFITD
jgi:hypothetical protein